MPTSRLPLTVPTFTHRYYENMVQFEPGRFRDLPAFRGFVGYQVRLVSALLSRARGFQVDSATEIARLNLQFRASDCDDLAAMLDAMRRSGLISPALADSAREELGELRLALLSAMN